jgi:hypothetical protein
MVRRPIFAATAGLTALALTPLPLAAQEAEGDEETVEPAEGAVSEELVFLTEEEEEQARLEQELTEAFSLFGTLFKTEPLTPEQQARLPLAEDMAQHMMPAGSFGVAMQESIAPMFDAIASELGSDPRTRLAEISGVDAEHLAGLSDETAQEALDIFDPRYAARTERISASTVAMIGKLIDAVEPAYRRALAEALAIRFEEAEMRELLVFFDTPLGGKFARESLSVQYDPRMMGVSEAMGPAMVEIFPEMEKEFAAIETEFGGTRDFTQLSAVERERAARLIGKSVSELDALVPEVTEEAAEGKDPIT